MLYEFVDWINQAEDGDQWRPLVNTPLCSAGECLGCVRITSSVALRKQTDHILARAGTVQLGSASTLSSRLVDDQPGAG
jgi:hypothetical protein